MTTNPLIHIVGILTFVFVFIVPVHGEPLALMLPGIGKVNVTTVLVETFDHPEVWETYASPTGVELAIERGIYRAFTANPGYVWGLNAQEHTNLVAEVQVTPLTPFQDVGSGVMCRADVSNNGDGYYFMINANGYYSIRIGQGNDVAPLIDWQPSEAIHSGIDVNTIRAVCLDNQLAMYVNDELVASINDDTYASGYAGLAVAASIHGVDMAFDNLTLYTVQLDQREA